MVRVVGRSGEAQWARFIIRLTDERLKAGLTQADVAEWMGTTQSAISDWESGHVHPGVGFIAKWGELFGLHLDWAEGDGGPP